MQHKPLWRFCWDLIKTPERRHYRRSGCSIVNCEYISHLLWCFYCWVWTNKCLVDCFHNFKYSKAIAVQNWEALKCTRILLRNGLTLPVPIYLNFYFQTSLWDLKRFYEGVKGLRKTFWGTAKKCENKNWI